MTALSQGLVLLTMRVIPRRKSPRAACASDHACLGDESSTLLEKIAGSISIFIAALLITQLGSMAATEQGSPGKVRFLLRIDPSIDPFVGSGNPYDEQWIRTHWWRMMVYSTWFDNKTRWYPGGLLYKDCSGIYPAQQDVLNQHPDWVLKDAAGNRLFIQYDCKPEQKMCSHYAADVGNPAFRQWWINEARNVISRGYKGLWIDDVNMSWRISNGEGEFVNPVSIRAPAG